MTQPSWESGPPGSARTAGAGACRLVTTGLIAGLMLACNNGGEGLAPRPHLIVDQTSLSFTAASGDPDPAPASIKITNGGSGTLNDLAVVVSDVTVDEPSWLELRLSGVVAPATLTVQPRISGLCTGNHSVTVEVRSRVADNSPQAIPVTFSVGGVAPMPPTVTTDTVIVGNPAMLLGRVNSNGSTTTVWFEWGTDASLTSSSSTSPQRLGVCTADEGFLFPVIGAAKTTYYFRAVASNSAGTVKGVIKSFQTP